MARLSRFLFGGVIGAGLALILSPKSGKEIRNMLTGSGRKQLTAAEADYQTPADYRAPAAAAAPEATAPQAPQGVTLESRLEETRQQVQQELGEPFIPEPVTPNPYMAEETIEPAVPVIEEPATPVIAAAAPATDEDVPALVEETAPAAVEEEPTAPVQEPEATMPPPAPVFEAEQMNPSPSPSQPAETDTGADVARAQHLAATSEWEALKTPAVGEPTLEADLNAVAQPQAEPTPAPSGIDRDEMRKRIDETRARLKAKAFDAMVSGETFLEGETGPRAPQKDDTAGPGMSQEMADRIDETLREED